MTDRELLELAAMAAGYEIIRWEMTCGVEVAILSDLSRWQPLLKNEATDCMGDALRLAATMRMRLEIADYYAIAQIPGAGVNCRENVTMGYGIDEATCRAITRAAAERGKAMK